MPSAEDAIQSEQHARAAGLADRTQRLSVWKKLLFSLVILAVVLAVVELFCRAAGLGSTEAVAHYVSDWHEMPDGRTFWVVRGKGFNSDGMRDREHTVEKPPGVYRIICLGDSVTFGHRVRRDQTYCHLLESFLRQLGLKVEVFNIATSGWSTRQEVTAYRVIGRKYQPDQVFLGFCLNDVAEMQNNLTAPPPALASFLVRHSALARWIVGAERRQIHNAEELLTNAEAPAVREGWKRVFDELTLLQEETQQQGCALSVLIFPFRFQLAPDAPPPLAQVTLFEFCRKRGIPCLDLLPALKNVGPSAFIDESHLSNEGARVVAEELVRWGRSGCVMCGFDLTGVQADACPQCGYPIQR